MSHLKLYIKLKEQKGLICGICKQSVEKEFEQLLLWFDVTFHNRTGLPRKKRTSINLDIDHIIPKSKGPPPLDSTNIANLQLSHRTCNRSKGASLDVDN